MVTRTLGRHASWPAIGMAWLRGGVRLPAATRCLSTLALAGRLSDAQSSRRSFDAPHISARAEYLEAQLR